jgi:hypothetical protein
MFAEWNQGATAAAGEETEAADTDETTREYMQQEAPQDSSMCRVRSRFLFL